MYWTLGSRCSSHPKENAEDSWGHGLWVHLDARSSRQWRWQNWELEAEGGQCSFKHIMKAKQITRNSKELSPLCYPHSHVLEITAGLCMPLQLHPICPSPWSPSPTTLGSHPFLDLHWIRCPPLPFCVSGFSHHLGIRLLLFCFLFSKWCISNQIIMLYGETFEGFPLTIRKKNSKMLTITIITLLFLKVPANTIAR